MKGSGLQAGYCHKRGPHLRSRPPVWPKGLLLRPWRDKISRSRQSIYFSDGSERLSLLFEFVIEGPPFSAQTHNRRRHAAWKLRVRNAALREWDRRLRPFKGHLHIVATYYHDKYEISLDNDNMVKPIQDALNGVVYYDDSQITDTQLRKTCIDGRFEVRGISVVLALAFAKGREFIHVQIHRAPDHGKIQ